MGQWVGALRIAPFLLALSVSASAQTIDYRVTIPAPQQHWLQVEATFPNLGTAPLRAYMSRSSPGRYAVHEFAKNVFWLEAYNGRGQALSVTRPNPYEWDVAGHDGTVKLIYKIFGDRVDGTYLAVDAIHAHMNMPATFMFDLDRQDRPIRVTFTRPAQTTWSVATQLYPTADPLTFTAPNLQYFMDSPTEFSDFLTAAFSIPDEARQARFRLTLHARSQDASQTDLEALATMTSRLVREERAVYGEFPQYEPGAYTFLLDDVPSVHDDGMEHRNSTAITGYESLKTTEGRQAALGTIAHEFFHNWNVERIRPAGLEPFDFTRANITCCLWLAEGFTQYYGPLLLTRAGFGRQGPPADPSAVINGSGRQVRSAVQMSEYAAFADAAVSIDSTDESRSFISYYTYGAAIALGLDLSIREMTDRAKSLDDFMRLLWQRFGKPAGAAPGLVARPYALADLRDALTEVTGNRTFAAEFFAKYVEGREVMDYARLLALAGFSLRHARPDAAWTGVDVRPAAEGVAVLAGRGQGLVPFGTPAYAAGLEAGDTIATIDGQPATPQVWDALRAKHPGDTVNLTVTHRGDAAVRRATLTLQADPSLEIVDIGGAMTPRQRAFRESWLGSKIH